MDEKVSTEVSTDEILLPTVEKLLEFAKNKKVAIKIKRALAKNLSWLFLDSKKFNKLIPLPYFQHLQLDKYHAAY